MPDGSSHPLQIVSHDALVEMIEPGEGESLADLRRVRVHDLTEQEYRLKLLKGTGDHIQRGIAQVAAPASPVTGLSPMVTGALG